jgi:hypothetical protein
VADGPAVGEAGAAEVPVSDGDADAGAGADEDSVAVGEGDPAADGTVLVVPPSPRVSR